MDAAKKSAVEKRVVIGLVIVFVIRFAWNPLMALVSRRAPSASALLSPAGIVNNAFKPIGQLMTDNWKKTEEAVENVTKQSVEPPLAPAQYTAGNLRDPMKSLLPATGPSQTPASSRQGATTNQTAPETPPPDLHVQGVLWGGEQPSAIINHKVYRLGEDIEGSRIVTIDRQGVTIDHLGTRVFYSVMPPSAADRAGSLSGQAHSWR